MSFMEKLLDGVRAEWKPLGKVVNTITAPAKLKRESYRETGITPIIDQGEKFITGYTDEAIKALPCDEYVIFGDHSEHIKYVDFSFIQGADGLKILKAISDSPKYVYYAFQNFYQKELNYKRHWARASETLIPIPCPDNPKKSLEIQAEIVRILDAFTAMTAELTAELSLRKKQYNYYRDQLLSFEEGELEWKTLGELVNDKFWIMPATPKFDENEDIPYITSKNISGGHIDFSRVKYISRQTYSDLSRNRPIICGDFLISMIGTIGEVARVKETDGDFYGQNMYLIRLNDSLIHSDYFLHFFDSPKMKSHFSSVKNNSGQGYLKANNIEDILVPIPSLAEQARIAYILDKFDSLTNSIKEGLPREIELRQQQYEYYRDLLLNFPKADSEVAA